MRSLVTFVLCLGLAAALNAATRQCLVPASTSGRLTVVISDTHFGVGRSGPHGLWHPFEDFRWTHDFDSFLIQTDQHGRGATDLILNGDTFELWQSILQDCGDDREEDYGCTEAEARGRLQRVLDQHSAEMGSLGRFASHGSNRVFIVPGNHDAALLFPKVAEDVVQAIPAPAGAVCVVQEGYWLSADGQIYTEHGHQIGEDVNSFGDRWPEPFLQANPPHLIRTWGERGVQKFYNDYEDKYQAIDNLDDEGAGMFYGLAAEGKALGMLGVAKFIRFALFDVSWAQFASSVGGAEKPNWDIPGIRQQGDRFLVESFRRDSPLREAAEKALATGELGLSLQQLTDDKIREICDRRAAEDAAQREAGQTSTVELCLGGNTGAAAQNLLTSRNETFSAYLSQTHRRLVQSGRLQAAKPFSVFVYSHTHHAEDAFKPLKDQWQPTVFNTGAWQRLIPRAKLDELKRIKKWNNKQILLNLKLEDLPACYSFVVVQPYQAIPVPTLAFWTQSKDGTWSVRKSCDPASASVW